MCIDRVRAVPLVVAIAAALPVQSQRPPHSPFSPSSPPLPRPLSTQRTPNEPQANPATTPAPGQFLYDAAGRKYLDCVNNPAHVGHCHPRVVEAASRQLAELNTNTRYLHANVVEYARRLAATLPDPLEVCFFVNSGSEANDLAVRLARAATGGRRHLVCVDSAYHGNLTSLVDISPYKYDGPGGEGRRPHVHCARTPDAYRGPHRDPATAGELYARDVLRCLDDARDAGGAVAAFFSEAILGCAGQVPVPPGYLRHAYAHVRARGGLCVADEVQTGFGRCGDAFWAFELGGVVPDIVTMGKPIGNGFPLGAVVTTRAVARAFANGMEYFSTTGGNPVSAAVGLAVLDVIRDERLQEHARRVGAHLRARFEALRDAYPLVGDVRGAGLFLGLELVRDRRTLEPAAREASWLASQMRERGVLISTDGPLHNCLKIKPPLAFSVADADRLADGLAELLPLVPGGASSKL